MAKPLTAWKPQVNYCHVIWNIPAAKRHEIIFQVRGLNFQITSHTPKMSNMVKIQTFTGHHSPTRHNHKNFVTLCKKKKITSLKEWPRCLHLCNTTTIKVSPFKFKIHCSDIFSTSKREPPLICTSTGVPWVLYHFSEHLYHNWKKTKGQL